MKTKPPQLLTVEQYVKGKPNLCPFCKSDEIEGEGVSIEDKEAFQDITCLSCGSQWMDRYKLSGYVLYAGPNKKEEKRK